jgi:hypothetical protein
VPDRRARRGADRIAAQAQTSSMRPEATRQVASGCADAAIYADLLGTVVWRSSASCPKTQTLPACGPYNSGAWIDAQSTAAAYPITITAVSAPLAGLTAPPPRVDGAGSSCRAANGSKPSWGLGTDNQLIAVRTNGNKR